MRIKLTLCALAAVVLMQLISMAPPAGAGVPGICAWMFKWGMDHGVIDDGSPSYMHSTSVRALPRGKVASNQASIPDARKARPAVQVRTEKK